MLRKRTLKFWDVNVDNIGISKWVKKKLIPSIWLEIKIKI